jgi:hypothetical protein
MGSLEKNPTHMCDSLARFGGYETLNVMMCPQIFSPGPQAREMLPLNEISGCLPQPSPPKTARYTRTRVTILTCHNRTDITFSQCTTTSVLPTTRTTVSEIARLTRRTDVENHASRWNQSSVPSVAQNFRRGMDIRLLIIRIKRVFAASWSRAGISRKAPCVCV